MDDDLFDKALNEPPQSTQSFTPPPKPKSRARWLIPVVLLAIVLLAVGGYALWQHSLSRPVVKPNTVAKHQQSSQQASAANQKVATKAYHSPTFKVEINYPTAWSVTADSSKGLIITSPVTQITTAAGAAVSGKIIMSMVPKGQPPAAVGNGATAVLNSAKVSYTQPTQTQRSSTYLTFAQYAATTTKGGLDAIYVTGNYGYQKTQNIPSTDLASIDPLISVSFEKCADMACTANLTPLTIAAADWNNSSFAAPIKTLLTSLAFE